MGWKSGNKIIVAELLISVAELVILYHEPGEEEIEDCATTPFKDSIAAPVRLLRGWSPAGNEVRLI